MNQYVLNCFEIENAAALRVEYRLYEADGPFDPDFGDGDVAERNLNQLVKKVQYAEKAPVAIHRSGARPVIAVATRRDLSRLDYDLSPYVAKLKVVSQDRVASPLASDGDDRRIGIAFLAWHLRSPFFRNDRFWSGSSSLYYLKSPLNYRDDSRDIDVYRGFGFRVDHVDGRLCVWVKLAHRYAESRWLLDNYDLSAIQQQLRMRHVLYHYGHRWFPVQILGISGRSIVDQVFIPDGASTSTNVHAYTLNDVGEAGRAAPWIRALDKTSPAIAYRYPGNEKKRSGAAALCKLLVPTDDVRAAKVHRWSIMDPARRLEETCRIVSQHFQNVRMGDNPIQVCREPLSVRRTVFPVPAQLFGQDKRFVIGHDQSRGEIQLRDMGRSRWEYLLDASGGVAVTSPLDAQYFVVPHSLERQVVDDVKNRLEKAGASLMKRSLTFSKVVYEDENRRTLKQQVDSIVQAIDGGRVKSGRGILILPARADRDLHNLLKRKLRDRFQFQCLDAGKLRGFYELSPNNGRATYVVKGELVNRFRSYVRYATMGYLLVNHQSPWVLAEPTHYDMYIGVDVLWHTAAFTFISQGGRRYHTKIVESQQSEKLSRAQVRTTVLDFLRAELTEGANMPRSIIFRRDGKSYRCEWLGLQDAVKILIQEGKLPNDVLVGMIEVHKTNAEGARLFEKCHDGTVRNPTVGAWKPLNDVEGILCTTGYPFSFSGTVKPLLIRLTAGDLRLDYILQDTFDFAQLCWPVPDRCMRLSIDLKLCDDMLRSNAAAADSDEGQFGEEEDFDKEFEHSNVVQ